MTDDGSKVLAQALGACGGSKALLAERLGCKRQVIYRWLKEGVPYFRLAGLEKVVDESKIEAKESGL